MQKDCSLMKGEKTASQNKDDGTHLPSQQKEQPTNFFERFLVEENKPEDNRNLNSDSLHEVDLNLSLCLGSVDKENSTLTRSSSIAGVMSSKGDSNEPEKSFLSLERSCSLPIDAEQLQRMIHLRELRTMRKDMPKKWLVGDKAKEKSPVPPKVAAWPPASSFRLTPTSSTNFHVKEEHVSQTVTVTGQEGTATANATSSFKSLSEPRKDGPVITPGTNSNEKLLKPVKTETVNPFKKPRISYGNFEDNGMEIMRQMPSVSTTGDGPNGRKVEGFLYRYMKGNVSIMCVCHGSFLSPAEFVKHAGGKDVPNPMKHITVYSTFSV